MMVERECSASEAAEDVKIGRLGSQSKGGSGERGIAIEPGASHVGAEKKMGDGFQGVSSSVAENWSEIRGMSEIPQGKGTGVNGCNEIRRQN